MSFDLPKNCVFDACGIELRCPVCGYRFTVDSINCGICDCGVDVFSHQFPSVIDDLKSQIFTDIIFDLE